LHPVHQCTRSSLYFRRVLSSVVRTLLGVASIAILGLLNATLTPRLAIAPLFGVIVALLAWHVGMRAGIVAALAAGAVGLVADVAWQPPDALTVWNAFAWTAAFVALALLVSRARTRHEAVAALENRVGELIQIEHSFARTDPLTSLCNRRAFIDALQQAEARSRRSGGALAVARLDIDNFRTLNETYSRADGDQLLRGVATSLALTTRMGDLAARLENDEFAILLYGCGPEDAQRVGQRLVAEVAELGRAYPEARTTASVGIACFASAGPDPDEMIRLAGAAMRRAREDGGNAVVVQREWTPGAQT
jgi:diguanylate cyclase (GGDEF)-like protein